MAGGGSDSGDGSDIFWPGFVDATTNLILNLLFLLTILIVAVFMFALELGRAVGPKNANADATAVAEEPLEKPQETVALRNEIARLKALLAEQRGAGDVKKGVGTSSVAPPEKSLDRTVSGASDVEIHFHDDAVSFKAEERAQLLEALKPVAAHGQASVWVTVPEGFSEAKRMGFYRALAVRNLLIEMNVPSGNIDVSVIEGATGGDASLVKVRAD